MIGPTGIWSAEEAKPDNYPHSELLCWKLLYHVFDQDRWIHDFGCGDAFYLKHLKIKFKKVVGYDGIRLRDEFYIFERDLSQPMTIEDRFRGQVLSLEVGEHIPREFEQQFIDNLCNACNSRMVISWAIEGQGGIGHVNCRNNAYIIEQIEKRGFKFNAKLSLYLRADIEMGVSYFKNTLMVFDRI